MNNKHKTKMTMITKRLQNLIAAGMLTTLSASAQNPYLPLWEHVPDGEPRVFADPDRPGKQRAYIIGSHDVRFRDYCGPDIRMWSAPVEDLTKWEDEGPIFTYNIDNQWDVMFAPDLVEVKGKDGKPEYYLFPHSRGNGRISFVAKSSRPDGPFKVINATEDGKSALDGSFLGFDPSIYVESITDKKDPDYKTGFRAYGFWGFQQSSAAQLDQSTMYSVRPGTEVTQYFIPASSRYGQVKDPAGTQYPALYKGQNPGDFNFFEASSIRKVGNKYVMVFSGYSGPDYGLGSTNSALRYAFGDSPMGPWRSGGVLVDSRGVVVNADGSKLITTNFAHNTHGSLQEINGQWYVFYHRPPRGFGNARQAAVAPVKIVWDEKSVADGGKVTITGYDAFAADETWTAKASDGTEYTGAEVTSEGFQVYGLPPYNYYSAGYACFVYGAKANDWMQDTWDWWQNSMILKGVTNGGIIGYKYFGFQGLKTAKKGLKPFAGIQKGKHTLIEIGLTPTTQKPFTVKVLLYSPWKDQGRCIATLNYRGGAKDELVMLKADVSQALEGMTRKHAVYLVAECDGASADEPLFDLDGMGFSCDGKPIKAEKSPKVQITVNGQAQAMPETPIRSTNQNGYTDVKHYQVSCSLKKGDQVVPSCSDKSVRLKVEHPNDTTVNVIATYKGKDKVYIVNGYKEPAPRRRFW